MIYRVILIVLLSASVQAASHCIRADASGAANGADWTDAWTNLPAVLIRGDTYYLADGDYGNYTANDAVDGTNLISIVKATASAHGPDTGWQATYGDGQAIFDKLSITTSYWLIDGATRTAINSGYGIKFATTMTNNNAITVTSGTTHHTLRYLEIDRGGYLEAEVEKNGLYGAPNIGNMLVQLCYFHDFQANAVTIHGPDNTFEHCYFLRGFTYGGVHSQAFQLFAGLNGATSYQSNTVIRYNIFEDIDGTAVVSMAGTLNGVSIYGNVFITTTNETVATARTIYDMSNGTTEPGAINVLVYNNLWYGYPDKPSIAGDRAGVFIVQSPNPSLNHVYNNYFYACIGTFLEETKADHDYNYFVNSTLTATSLSAHESSVSGSDPTINGAGYNFHFLTRGPSGVSLAAPFNIDPDGRIRGADGSWDIGAYEYQPPSATAVSVRAGTIRGPTP